MLGISRPQPDPERAQKLLLLPSSLCAPVSAGMMFKRDNDDDSGGPSPQHQQPLPWLRVKDVAALLLESPANLHDSRGFFFFSPENRSSL